MSTPAHVLVTKDKVQRYLGESFGAVEVGPRGEFTLQQGSSRIFIECDDWHEERSIVRLTVPLLFGCEPTPALFRHVALHADDYLFGHLSAFESDGKIDVFFTHVLLGEYLDSEELFHAVLGMAAVGDKIDNELQAEFGGRRFHEEVV